MTNAFDLIDKTGLGTASNGICLVLFIFVALWASLKFYGDPKPLKSKIVRKVKGHPAHPRSIRNLFGISPAENRHILMSLKASAFVADRCLKLPEKEFLKEMEHMSQISTYEGFGIVDLSALSSKELRKILRRQHRICLKLITKFENVCSCGIVRGIRPSDYGVLIQTLQSGWNEAYAFTNMEPEKLEAYMQAARTMLKNVKRWEFGLPIPRDGEDKQRFYVDRAFRLKMILERVNQPYHNVVYLK